MGLRKEQLTASRWLSPDRPIERRSEDELGRRGFSEELANAIRAGAGSASLVLALYGKWGNGKSSIKNMLIDTLKDSEPRVRCVDFNPWQLANRPSLSEAFFDELGIALGKGDLGSNRQKKSTLDKFKRWASRLQGAQDLARSTRNLFVATLVFFGVAILGSAWVIPQWISIILGVVAILMALLALFTKVVEACVKFFAAGSEVGARAINEVKDELAEDLKKLKAPILIILDDLDRLTPQEILEVFQLIKANADFPNIIYLTLCDRSIVESHIEQSLNVSGRDYLEKIIQVAIDVPMIDIDRVRQVLFGRLNRLLESTAISKHFDQKRWANLFWSSLHSYFSTLRDVNRFTSTLSFHLSSFYADGELEVNPVDLIALEVIRLNEPEFYKALQINKDVLVGSRYDRDDKKAATEALEAIVETGSEEHQDNLRELLQQLFPETAWALDGPHYATEYGREWYRDLRVCAAKLFDRYFRLTISEKELSQGTVRRLLEARGDRTRLSSLLLSLHERELLPLAIEELAVHEDELIAEQVESYITAIFDIGDMLLGMPGGALEIPVQWRVGYLIQHALEKIEKPESRAETLVRALRNTSGLGMAIDVAEIFTDTSSENKNPPYMSGGQAEEVRAAAQRMLANATESGALAKSPQLARLLGSWRRLGGADEVARIADTISRTPEGTIALLRSLELRAVVHEGNDYMATEQRYFERKDIEFLIPMVVLAERVNAIPKEALDAEGLRLMGSFQQAVERWKAGKPDGRAAIREAMES